MAQIDAYLKAVLDAGGEELILATGQPPGMRSAAGVQPMAQFTLTSEQIEVLLGEVAPGRGEPKFTFPYSSPSGPITGAVQRSNGIVQALFRKGAGLPSPAPAAPAPAPAPAPAKPSPAPVAPAPAAPAPAAPPASPSIPTHASPSLSTGGFAGQSPAPSKVRTGPAPEIDKLFEKMMKAKASDLHLSSDVTPMIRVDGSMMPIAGEAPIGPEALWKLLEPITPKRNQEQFKETHDTDFAYEIEGLGRFRSNIFRDRKGPGAVFRIIPTKILTAEDLGLPEAVRRFAALSKGLVLVTGPTGSGKSTTLAAVVDLVNASREDHIITIEDPIEFVHPNKKCLLNQREVHAHTLGFKNALRAALREDPDIVLVGEMRDLETIAIAIETAETGHLVFGTLHTTTAASTVDRIIDQFPQDRQEQIRVMLSESLKGVVSQTLLKKIGGGRVAALEILVVTPAVSNLIREGKTFQIPSIMQTSKAEGMQLLNEVLADYVKKGVIEAKEAYIKAVDKKSFIQALEQVGVSVKPLMAELAKMTQ